MKVLALAVGLLGATMANAQSSQPMGQIRVTETVVTVSEASEQVKQQFLDEVVEVDKTGRVDASDVMATPRQELMVEQVIDPNRDNDRTAASQAPNTPPTPKPVTEYVTPPKKELPAPVRGPNKGRATLEGGKAIALPGLGDMPGTKPAQKNNVLRMNSDQTEIVRISGALPNRIATPFAKPKAIVQQGSVTVVSEGQSLYVSTVEGSLEPIALFITGGDGSEVLSLTLVPTYDLPPQIITVQLDGSELRQTGGNAGLRQEDTQSAVYTDRIIGILRQIALNQTPAGFARGALPYSALNLGPIVAKPVNRYSGQNFDVYRYRIEALVDYQIEMEESAFWKDGVRAVAFFPSAVVGPGRPTEVLVVADKSATR